MENEPTQDPTGNEIARDNANLEVIAGFPVHPIASFYPFINPGDLDESIESSIEKQGIKVPVVFDQHGRLVDGKNRLKAWLAIAECKGESWAKKYPIPKEVIEFKSDSEIFQFCKTRNETRRHLTPDQRAVIFNRIRQYFEGIEGELWATPAAGRAK